MPGTSSCGTGPSPCCPLGTLGQLLPCPQGLASAVPFPHTVLTGGSGVPHPMAGLLLITWHTPTPGANPLGGVPSLTASPPPSHPGFARMRSTATTRPPSGWTLKSSASRLPESPTASRCKPRHVAPRRKGLLRSSWQRPQPARASLSPPTPHAHLVQLIVPRG